MSFQMKKLLLLILLVFVLISAWFVYSKVTQARRETVYRAAIAPFQRDLPLNMTRTDVQKYLDSRNVSYHATRLDAANGDTYLIKIGEDPGNLVCESWTVYIALEFNSENKLRDIHIRKIGTCL
jgi:hypothetical protein